MLSSNSPYHAGPAGGEPRSMADVRPWVPFSEIITVVLLAVVIVVAIRLVVVIVKEPVDAESLASVAPRRVQSYQNQKKYESYLDAQAVALKNGDAVPRVAGRLSEFLDESGYIPDAVAAAALESLPSREARLAALVVRHAGLHLKDDPESGRVLLLRCRVEYRSAYNTPLPDFAVAYFHATARQAMDWQNP
jgi:hypothetical protein